MREKPRGAKRTTPLIPEAKPATPPAEISHRSPRGSGPSARVTVRLKKSLLEATTREAHKRGLDLSEYIRSALAGSDHGLRASLAIDQLRARLEELRATKAQSSDRRIAYGLAVDALDETVRRFKL